jgi:hypothetical protein
MSAVARLIWTYFTGTLLARVFAILGLAAMLAGDISMLIVPSWTLGAGLHPALSMWMEGLLDSLAWQGVLALFFASSLLPVVLDRIALGRQIRVLPWGRLRLLASVVCTAALIALLTAGTAVLAYYKYPIPISLGAVFVRTFLVAFVNFGIMYVAVWLVSKARTGAGLLASSMLVLLSIGLPLRYIGSPTGSLAWPVGLGLFGWLAFSVLLLAGAHVSANWHVLRARASAFAARALRHERYLTGRETALYLGTDRPWLFALGQTLPLVIAALLAPLDLIWLFFLTLFSAISGAVTSYAAERSRSLWLRSGWTRAELFERVERAYLLHNGYAAVVLLLLLATLVSYFDAPSRFVIFGVPLLVLGTVTSSYLGLTITRGLGLVEAVLAIGTMLLLMVTGLAIARPEGASWPIIGLETALVALALLYRSMAKAHWHALDWMLCRPDRLTLTRRAA